jgi:hypothetical protein
MRCLLLYVLAIVCPVMGISHHLPPHPTNTQDEVDSPPHPSNPAMQMTTTQLMMMQKMSNADNNADVDADNNNAMQTTDNDSDDR